MDIAGSVALVTGANRGLGRSLAAELVRRGARVYAGARNQGSIDLPGVTPVTLDITDPSSVSSALEAADDITILVNNAGISTGTSILNGDLDAVRREMETHFFGTLSVTRAAAPVIAANGGGAVLNILSALSWLATPRSSAYCAAKSAEWSLTNALRLELATSGIRVSALHVGFMDTDMTRLVEGPKLDPADVARAAVDGIAAGAHEILVDDVSRSVQAKLAGGVGALYPELR